MICPDSRTYVSLLNHAINVQSNFLEYLERLNLHTENGLKYLEIHVDKYPSMISYHEKYYYRSVSTMSELTGVELDTKLLKAQGKSWAMMPVPKLRVSDLDAPALNYLCKESVKRYFDIVYDKEIKEAGEYTATIASKELNYSGRTTARIRLTDNKKLLLPNASVSFKGHSSRHRCLCRHQDLKL